MFFHFSFPLGKNIFPFKYFSVIFFNTNSITVKLVNKSKIYSLHIFKLLYKDSDHMYKDCDGSQIVFSKFLMQYLTHNKIHRHTIIKVIHTDNQGFNINSVDKI